MRVFSTLPVVLRRWWAEACTPAPPFPLCEDEWESVGQLAARGSGVLEALRPRVLARVQRGGTGLSLARARWVVLPPIARTT